MNIDHPSNRSVRRKWWALPLACLLLSSACYTSDGPMVALDAGAALSPSSIVTWERLSRAVEMVNVETSIHPNEPIRSDAQCARATDIPIGGGCRVFDAFKTNPRLVGSGVFWSEADSKVPVFKCIYDAINAESGDITINTSVVCLHVDQQGGRD